MGWIILVNYRNAQKKYYEAEENPFLISISDLMAGLLTIFILALVYYILSLGQQSAKLMGNEEKRKEILSRLKEELEEAGIVVHIDKGVLHLPEGVLFDVGEAEIKESGWQTIRTLAPLLSEVLQEPEYKDTIETVFIEGHTDNSPIYTVRFPSNWELSAQRAINTWLAMTETCPELGGMTNKNAQPLFSCSGYAETRPIDTNETPEGKSRNRRIDLRFTMVPPEAE